MGDYLTLLEDIRSNLRLSKAAFAKAMGITPHYYYGILNGRANFRLEHLASLTRLYHVNPVRIILGEGDMFLSDDSGRTANVEPTEEDIQALYDYTLQKEPTPINLTTMQALRFRAACLRSFLENPQFNTLDQLRAVARVYLWFIAKHPNLEI